MVPRSWAGEGKNKSHPNIIYFLKTHYVPGILSGMLHLPAHHILLTALKSGYYYYLLISHEETASQRLGDLPKLLGVTELGFQPKFSTLLCSPVLFTYHQPCLAPASGSWAPRRSLMSFEYRLRIFGLESTLKGQLPVWCLSSLPSSSSQWVPTPDLYTSRDGELIT